MDAVCRLRTCFFIVPITLNSMHMSRYYVIILLIM